MSPVINKKIVKIVEKLKFILEYSFLLNGQIESIR